MWSGFCSTKEQTGRSCKSCSPILTACWLLVTLPSSCSGRRGRSTLYAELREPTEGRLGLRALAVGDPSRRWPRRSPAGFAVCRRQATRRRPGTLHHLVRGLGQSEQILLGKGDCRHRTRSAAGRLRVSDPEAAISDGPNVSGHARSSPPSHRRSAHSSRFLSRMWSRVAQQEAPS
jgi:hypothetical protein